METDDNQAEAVKYVEEIKAKTDQGIFTELPLNKLQDIPISTVPNPLFIARTVLMILGNDNIWTRRDNFQVRYTISRLARSYMVSYTFLKTYMFKQSYDQLVADTSEIQKMIAVQNNANEMDSGIKLSSIVC
mmetsp:Transcript_34429/g.60376  ORF Transcript_34429/g.60376 Transcript_34429/m.60376 type:complete len:132 (+) Transcript_34429:354-749(+)